MSLFGPYVPGMSDEELTLEELSERTGVEPRTLRSWVSEGLLAPPFRPGRGARYPGRNADRALAVRALKEVHGLSLSEIGRRFMMATDDQIRAWALEAEPLTQSRGSVREYLRSIRLRNGPDDTQEGAGDSLFRARLPADSFFSAFNEPDSGAKAEHSFLTPHSASRQAELASIEQLILELEKVTATRRTLRKGARGTPWTRFEISPDIELAVRGPLEPGERALFERLADNFRAILTGRTRK